MIKKDYTLDFIKIISMILVVIVHTSNCYLRFMGDIPYSSYVFACIYNGVSRICVPLFFMVSGALLIKKEYTKLSYFQRIKKMCIVLIFWTVVYIIFGYFFHQKYPKNLLLTLFSPYEPHLWFMYAIISLYIALPFICKMSLNLTKGEENLFILLWLILSGGGFILELILDKNITYEVPIISGTYYLGYFLCGHILYDRIKRLKNCKIYKKYNIHLLAIFIISNLIILIASLIASNVLNTYYKDLFTYTSIFTSLCALSSFALILINVNIKSEKSIKCMNNILPLSLGIYLVQCIFIDIIKEYINLKLYHSSYAVLIYSIITFILSFAVIFIISKIKFLKKYIL